MTEALRRVRADLARRTATRSVVMAHAFVAGGQPSDSERDISVGGVQHVSAGLFEGIDYTALGHLHGRHVLAPALRYSGSPLAYSFSEASHRKGCWLVQLDAGGFIGAEFAEAPVPRPLARLRGHLDDLLEDPRHAAAESAWVQAVLTDPVRPAQAKLRLERRFPHVLSLGFEPEGAGPVGVPAARTGGGLSDHEMALDFVRDLRERPADDVESALLRAACDACCDDADLDPGVVA